MSFASIAAGTSIGESNAVDTVERDALRSYLSRQFAVLTRCHSVDDIILLRVLADNHQHAALQAKKGSIATARSEMRALDTMALPDKRELHILYRVSARPAWALIHWFENDHQQAIQQLEVALCACAELAADYDHDYLTGKRIYLAANVARVLMSLGASGQALDRVTALKAVLSGDRSKWHFGGSESLEVPLNGAERLGLEHQLSRITHVHVGSGPTPVSPNYRRDTQ